MQPLSILASGMVTSVGLNAPAACAAIRAGIDNMAETRFMDSGGKWIVGSSVPLDPPWRGRAKMVHLVVPAIRECLNAVRGIPTEQIPLMLCVAEKDRPGRLEGLDDKLFYEVATELDLSFHERSMVIAGGRVGGVWAIQKAQELLYQERVSCCLVAGVDTYLVSGTLREYVANNRILTDKNSDGFIPGEAGSAILIGKVGSAAGKRMTILGIGFGTEKATIASEVPLRADGLVQAIKQALAESGMTMGDLDYRIADLSGEQYGFKEADLAVTRLLREHKDGFDIWHPADCMGEVGAAAVPCILGVALAAARKKYAPGDKVLCHVGNDDGKRAAIILG
jgi:3-oxoacyl-[acyl-carrier-protein] synthase-1